MTNGSRGQVGTDLATRVRPRPGARVAGLFHVEQWPPGRGLGMGTRWGPAGVRWCSGWVSDDDDPYHHPTATPRFSREMRNVIQMTRDTVSVLAVLSFFLFPTYPRIIFRIYPRVVAFARQMAPPRAGVRGDRWCGWALLGPRDRDA